MLFPRYLSLCLAALAFARRSQDRSSKIPLRPPW